VLAADLPFLGDAQVTALVTAAVGAAGDAAGAVVADESGMAQWLAGCWDTGRLRDGLAGYAGGSLRGLLRPMRPAMIQAAAPDGAPSPWLDCDTPAELDAARAWLASGAAPGPGPRPGGKPARP
jgi:molybdopterin-guanine dinucleotide biosynthesis protein A